MRHVCRLLVLSVGFTALALLVSAVLPGNARGQWVIRSEDGASSIKFGLLAQGRAEWGMIEDVDPVSQQLYLRRARILLGGDIRPGLSFFMDTDSPNLGRAGADGGKAYGDMYVQDLAATYACCDALLLDGGLLLVPTSYNHLQSAASLLTLDYGPATFIESEPLEGRVGRDSGIQARGLLAGHKIEYRAGLFQGIRGPRTANPFRGTARVSIHPFGTASRALFYSGTGFGKTRVLQIGGAADFQKDYQSVHGDFYVEAPLSPAAAVTLQGDVSKYDGGDFLPGLVKQTVILVEGGVTLRGQFALWAQGSVRDYDPESRADQTSMQLGGTYAPSGHRANVKLALTRVSEDAPSGAPESPDRTTVTLQYQGFYF